MHASAAALSTAGSRPAADGVALAACRIDSVKSVSSKMAAVSTSVAGAVGSAIGSVAAAASDRAQQHKALAPEGSKSRRVLSTCKVGVVAVVDVFDAMHDAGRHIVTTGADETATCVQYRCARGSAHYARDWSVFRERLYATW